MTESDRPSETNTNPSREPLTPRRASRRQALISSLRKPGSALDEAEAFRDWGSGVRDLFGPKNAWQEWMVEPVATTTFRISRLQEAEQRLREWTAFQAIDPT